MILIRQGCENLAQLDLIMQTLQLAEEQYLKELNPNENSTI
jgi:hypothetical protein